MYLHSWLVTLLGAYSEYAWMMHGIIIFLAAFFVYWLQRKLVKLLLVHLKKTNHVWDDTLLQALSLPLALLIWMCAAALFLEYVLLDMNQKNWSQEVIRVRIGISVLIFVWFSWRYISLIEQRLVTPSDSRKKVDETTVSVVGRFMRIGFIVAGMLILLEALGIPLTGLLAFGGGGAIVMGIAAQQLLANWFGGLMIFLDKPFKLGDWIQSPDRNIEGVVTRIGWRTTKVMALDNRPLYIPNALFNQVVIVNPQRMTHRRIDATIGIRYDDGHLLKGLVRAIDQMLRQHPNVDSRQTLMAHFVNFGRSSLDINIYCFTRATVNPHWRDVQQDIFFKILDIIAEHKVQIAFPTVTTHIPDGVSIRGDLRS